LKLSKTSWLIIIIGVFVIVLIGLGIVRSQQVHQQNELNEQLALTRSKIQVIQLEQLSLRQGDLERQLSETDSQSESAKKILSQPVRSVTISDFLFDTAEANSVNITEINSSGLASEELAGVTCSVLPFTAKVEGELTNLVSYITKLNNDLATGFVKSVEISVPETSSTKKPSANIQLIIYTYQGG
jgi:cell division protein FtsB